MFSLTKNLNFAFVESSIIKAVLRFVFQQYMENSLIRRMVVVLTWNFLRREMALNSTPAWFQPHPDFIRKFLSHISIKTR